MHVNGTADQELQVIVFEAARSERPVPATSAAVLSVHVEARRKKKAKSDRVVVETR